MQNIVWKNRANAILGFFVLILAIFPGIPGTLKTTLFIILGLLITVFGFAGSRLTGVTTIEKGLARRSETKKPAEEEALN
jgi:type III secretory pathway component EscV